MKHKHTLFFSSLFFTLILKGFARRMSYLLLPGAAEGRTWEDVKSDLGSILGQLNGMAESKLEKMRDIIYSYGKERFEKKKK